MRRDFTTLSNAESAEMLGRALSRNWLAISWARRRSEDRNQTFGSFLRARSRLLKKRLEQPVLVWRLARFPVRPPIFRYESAGRERLRHEDRRVSLIGRPGYFSRGDGSKDRVISKTPSAASGPRPFCSYMVLGWGPGVG